MDLALNNLEFLICQETQPTNQPTNISINNQRSLRTAKGNRCNKIKSLLKEKWKSCCRNRHRLCR